MNALELIDAVFLLGVLLMVLGGGLIIFSHRLDTAGAAAMVVGFLLFTAAIMFYDFETNHQHHTGAPRCHDS